MSVVVIVRLVGATCVVLIQNMMVKIQLRMDVLELVGQSQSNSHIIFLLLHVLLL